MKNKPFIFLFILSSAVLLSGCWDRTEVQKLDIVSAIGIDTGGDEDENNYRVTAQIINEGQISGATGKGGAGGESPVAAYSASGSTVLEALRKIETMSSHELFFPHIQIMIIGEELARTNGIQDLFDSLDRMTDFRTNFPVLVIRNNTAEKFLQVTTPLEKLPASYVLGGLETLKNQRGEYDMINADQMIKQIEWGGGVLAGAQITGSPEEGNKMTNIQEISPQTKLAVKGLGMFKEGKLQNWMDEELSRGFSWINNDLKQTVVHLDCGKKKDGIAIKIDRSNTKIKPTIKNKKPTFDISVRSTGSFDEVQCPIDLTKYKTFNQYEKQLEKEIKQEITMTLAYAKKQKNDIFHFGEYVNRKDTKLWKNIEKEWDEEIFPQTEVNVNVKTSITRSGLRTKSYLE